MAPESSSQPQQEEARPSAQSSTRRTTTAGGASSSFAPTRRNSFLLNLLDIQIISRRRKSALLNKRRRRSEAGDRAEEEAAIIAYNGGSWAALLASIIRSAVATMSTTSTTTTFAGISMGIFLVVLHYWNKNKKESATVANGQERSASHYKALATAASSRLLPTLRSSVERIRLRRITMAAPRMLLQLHRQKKKKKKKAIKSKTSPSPRHHGGCVTTSSTTTTTTWKDGGEESASSSSSFYYRYKENTATIRRILNYWFNQYDSLDELEKKLWMIPSQQSELRHKVDEEISNEFTSVLLDLVSLSSSSSSSRWSEWCGRRDEDDIDDDDYDEQDDMYGYQGKVAAIVVLDQFSRHIRRRAGAIAEEEEKEARIDDYNGEFRELLSKLPEQSVCDDLAYRTAKLFAKRYHHFDDCNNGVINDSDTDNSNNMNMHMHMNNMVPIPMQVFALMPFRHQQANMRSIRYVQQYIATCLDEQHKQCGDLISRFRKATNRRMNILLDESRRTGGGSAATAAAADDDGDDDTDDNILECGYMKVDMTSSQNHIVHQTVCNFFENINTKCSIGPASKTRAGIIPPPPTPIIVSLSGGVDSMVILSVLSYLQSKCLYHINIIALHIDYGNRPESVDEANYLQHYCQHILGNVTFKCKRIDSSIKRSGGPTSRDEYERLTRQIRYDFYRQSIEQAKIEQHGNRNNNIGIILGHHRGDIRENVLSNAHRGCGPLDLSGMTSTSNNDGVTIFRPLLSLEKDDIYDYAHKYGVPYFKDTTPHWSTRGKLRKQLLPLLQEIYGDGSMNNLTTLARESDDCRMLVHELAFQPFLSQIHCKPMGITFPTKDYKNQDIFFWKYVLREALHSAKLAMFTDKSVKSFMERIQAKKLREGWLQCRKDYGVYLRSDGQIYVLYPSSFPWSKSQEEEYKKSRAVIGDEVLYGPENAVRIGPWLLSAGVVDEGDTTEKQEQLLEMKAVPSMDAFMNGSYEYYVEARTWQKVTTTASSDSANNKESSSLVLFEPRPLVFTSFTKETRPRAWKNADTKIQNKLPLLGNDDVALKALKDPDGFGATHNSATTKKNGIADNSSSTVVVEEKENPIVLVKVSLRLVDK